MPTSEAGDLQPSDILQPPASVWERLVERIQPDQVRAQEAPVWQWSEPDWEQVGPGIECKLMSADAEHDQLSLLVRLAPGADYPPHTHAGVEELHLLHGELWIDDRQLHPGEFYRAEPGTSDHRVWSETGCTCVLLTSSRDVLHLPQG